MVAGVYVIGVILMVVSVICASFGIFLLPETVLDLGTKFLALAGLLFAVGFGSIFVYAIFTGD